MILYILLFSVVFCLGFDIWAWRARVRKGCRSAKIGFWAVVGLTYLSMAILAAGSFMATDNGPAWMRATEWLIWLWLVLQLGRLAYYIGMPFRRRWIGWTLASIMTGTLIYGIAVGRRDLEVRKVEIVHGQLPAAFNGYKVVQFSDLHIGALLRPEREITRIVSRINELHPDLVLFTGDLVNIRHTELTPRYRAILEQIQAPVYSVLGNHDVGRYVHDTVALPPLENTRALVRKQRAMGWQLLEDQTVWIHRGTDSIALTGLTFDPEHHRIRHAQDIPDITLEKPYAGVPEDSFDLTMAHLPQLWNTIRKYGRADLTVSGHVHAMQIKIHLFGHAYSPAQWLYTRWSGRYDAGADVLYINDGIGYVGYPMRLGARPEITLFTLCTSSPR